MTVTEGTGVDGSAARGWGSGQEDRMEMGGGWVVVGGGGYQKGTVNPRHIGHMGQHFKT